MYAYKNAQVLKCARLRAESCRTVMCKRRAPTLQRGLHVYAVFDVRYSVDVPLAYLLSVPPPFGM